MFKIISLIIRNSYLGIRISSRCRAKFWAHAFSLFSFLFLLMPSSSVGQIIDTTDTSVQNEFEEIFEEIIEDTEDTQAYEMVEYLLENPIEVNRAAIDDLTKIPFINSQLADDIIKYRGQYGSYYTIGELNNVPGMTKELFAKIKPYVVIDKSRFAKFDEEQNAWEEVQRKSFSQLTDIEIRSRTTSDLQRRKAFTTGKYYDSPIKQYQRMKLAYDKTFKLNLLAEKDAGEKSLTDFYSGNLSVNNFSVIKNFVAGDYVLEFGQGLTLWRQIGFSKGADAIYPMKKKGSGVIPYTSSDENQFFRGAAGSIKYSDFIFHAFYSANTFDANIDTSTGFISSRPTDGYHRSESEQLKKNQSNEKMFGGRIDYQLSRRVGFGLMHYQSRFNNSLALNSSFKSFEDSYNYTSFDFNAYFETLNIYGEISRDKNNVFATIVGLQSGIGRAIDFVILFRNYPARFLNLHGYGFGERNGTTRNETGIYSGVKLTTRYGRVNFYYDHFYFPYPLTYDKSPTKGYEFLTEYVSPTFSGSTFLIRYKHENKELNEKGLDEYNRTQRFSVNRLQQNLRFEVQKVLTSNARVRFRTEIVDVYYTKLKPHEVGYLVFGDVRIEPIRNLKVSSRIIYFQTQTYDSRVYEFENDLTGVLYNPGLYGRGMRWYVVAQYKIWRMLTLSFKYAETYRDDVKKISSGDSEINNNLDNKLSLQIEIRL
ncbi:MAG: helix-hairpin-helix domain-containing protein [Ignavibacteria bacterium]|nr:helix-hairpin-helix domain-containing protein [Ignavibacteria bacterium]